MTTIYYAFSFGRIRRQSGILKKGGYYTSVQESGAWLATNFLGCADNISQILYSILSADAELRGLVATSDIKLDIHPSTPGKNGLFKLKANANIESHEGKVKTIADALRCTTELQVRYDLNRGNYLTNQHNVKDGPYLPHSQALKLQVIREWIAQGKFKNFDQKATGGFLANLASNSVVEHLNRQIEKLETLNPDEFVRLLYKFPENKVVQGDRYFELTRERTALAYRNGRVVQITYTPDNLQVLKELNFLDSLKKGEFSRGENYLTEDVVTRSIRTLRRLRKIELDAKHYDSYRLTHVVLPLKVLMVYPELEAVELTPDFMSKYHNEMGICNPGWLEFWEACGIDTGHLTVLELIAVILWAIEATDYLECNKTHFLMNSLKGVWNVLIYTLSLVKDLHHLEYSDLCQDTEALSKYVSKVQTMLFADLRLYRAASNLKKNYQGLDL